VLFFDYAGVPSELCGFRYLPFFIDAIRLVMPSLFLFENVRGLLCANKGYFEKVLDELQDLGYISELVQKSVILEQAH
jgi:site-specific DNA-cytosine methylase